MIINPLLFYISPQWKQSNTNSSIDTQENFSSKYLHKSKSLDTWHNQIVFNHHKNNFSLINLNQTTNKIFFNSDFSIKSNHQYLTINLNQIDQNIRTAKDLKQILNDIQTYRNQLHDTSGSIHIQIYSSQSKRCYCNKNQSIEICKQISRFENELFQNDFVEYIYKIESIKHNHTRLSNE